MRPKPSKIRWRRSGLLAFLLLSLTAFEPASANQPPPGPRASGFVVLYDPASVSAFLSHPTGFDTIYLDTAVVTPGGSVKDSASATLVETLAAPHVPIVLTVSNLISSREGQDARLLESLFRHPKQEAALASALAKAVDGAPFTGINIDFEGLPRRDGPPLDHFLRVVGQALHREHKTLSIDVPPLTRRDARNSAFSYRAIGERVDEVLIMAYDFSYPGSPPGPIAPLWWVRQVIAYARTTIPSAKIVLGLPFYGYDWTGRRAVGLTLAQVQALMTQHHAHLQWNRRGDAPFFRYVDRHRVRHTVYFANVRSLCLELAAARAEHIGRVFYWFVGSGTTPVWRLVSSYQP